MVRYLECNAIMIWNTVEEDKKRCNIVMILKNCHNVIKKFAQVRYGNDDVIGTIMHTNTKIYTTVNR